MAAASGVALSEVVLSNGLHLRSQQAAWLSSAAVKLMVSLDGVGAVHDRQRSLKGGAPTFAKIERTVDNVLLPNGVRPDIGITVTGSNAHGIADAVRWALQRELPVSLNLYRQNPLSASRAELALEEDAIIEGMKAAYAVFEESLPIYPFFNGLLDRVQGQAHSRTCGAGSSYLVVTHEGKLAQCHMRLEEPVAQWIGDDALRLVAAGSLRNIEVEAKEDCVECLYRHLCTGGCPLETYRVTGKWDIRSPHCRIYRSLMPEALRLEGLRLLKVNGYLT